MASKFKDFLDAQKIDPRRLLAASNAVERLTREDRTQVAQRAAAKSRAKEGEKIARVKGHSGRPVTPRLVQDASAGKPVSGPAKTRLLRAVNRILDQKKQPVAELKQLF
jgi:hypothetical protein